MINPNQILAMLGMIADTAKGRVTFNDADVRQADAIYERAKQAYAELEREGKALREKDKRQRKELKQLLNEMRASQRGIHLAQWLQRRFK